MKKGKATGIGITVIVAAVVFGIASLPDEVLLETPIAASENIPTETFSTEFQPEIISSEEQTVEPKVAEPKVAEPKVAEPKVAEPKVAEPKVAEPKVTEPKVTEPEVTEPEESEGKVIAVKINDGVGAAMR